MTAIGPPRIEGLRVIHARECAECGGQGVRYSCQWHGGGCPCERETRCEDCNGDGVRELTDCGCDACWDAWARIDTETEAA